MIALPLKSTEAGLETRLLLAECRGPAYPSYNITTAALCMQLMDRVLWNRVDNWENFLAHSDTLLGVVTAPGQFQGFEHYPHYSKAILDNIQQLLDIANAKKSPRSFTYMNYLSTAIQVANAISIADPSPGSLSAWRTGGSASPGANFTLYKTVAGIDFYYL